MFCYRTPTNDCSYITAVHESCSKLKKDTQKHSSREAFENFWKIPIYFILTNPWLTSYTYLTVVFWLVQMIRDKMWMSRNLKLARVSAIFDGSFSLLCFVFSKQNLFVSLPSKHPPEKNEWNMVKVNKKNTRTTSSFLFTAVNNSFIMHAFL